MSFKLRSSPLALYRFFFVTLLLATGTICIATWLLESFFGISIINVSSDIDYKAILVTCGVTGIISMSSGILMLLLMIDRRTLQSDRRQQQHDINFPDRRTSKDRRLE